MSQLHRTKNQKRGQKKKKSIIRRMHGDLMYFRPGSQLTSGIEM